MDSLWTNNIHVKDDNLPSMQNDSSKSAVDGYGTYCFEVQDAGLAYCSSPLNAATVKLNHSSEETTMRSELLYIRLGGTWRLLV